MKLFEINSFSIYFQRKDCSLHTLSVVIKLLEVIYSEYFQIQQSNKPNIQCKIAKGRQNGVVIHSHLQLCWCYVQLINVCLLHLGWQWCAKSFSYTPVDETPITKSVVLCSALQTQNVSNACVGRIHWNPKPKPIASFKVEAIWNDQNFTCRCKTILGGLQSTKTLDAYVFYNWITKSCNRNHWEKMMMRPHM